MERMRLPRRSDALPDDTPPTRRRARTIALALVAGLIVASAAYVVLSDDAPDLPPPIYVGGSTFIPPLDLDNAPRATVPPKRTKPEPTPVAATTASRRLVIPTLGVDSQMVSITAPGGTLTPPSDAQQVGWWSAGAEPGAEQGSALVTGHTLSTGSGALQDLETLGIGDEIAVRTVDGSIQYRVSDVEIFSKGALAQQAGELFSQAAPGRLVVITCEDFDGTAYLSNVVVTATPIGRSTVDF